jgi:hypothetical protein
LCDGEAARQPVVTHRGRFLSPAWPSATTYILAAGSRPPSKQAYSSHIPLHGDRQRLPIHGEISYS